MNEMQVIFYVLSVLAIFSGMMVITARNPVHGVLFLVLTFFCMAGIWLLLEAEFLALILVLVYVGAVMTLFLFVVMMLRIHVVSFREGFVHYFIFGLMTVVLVSALTLWVVGPARFGLALMPAPEPAPADFNNITRIGMVLYTDYAYPFEIAAVMLLTAIVAAISLAHRKPSGRKSQNITQQLSAQRDQRVRLIKMPTEKKQKPHAPEAPV